MTLFRRGYAVAVVVLVALVVTQVGVGSGVLAAAFLAAAGVFGNRLQRRA